MSTNLVIPQTLKVGYVNRSDTFTGKLAYVTYIDSVGKHRKQSSWESWRDISIPSDDFKNDPIEGIVLNKVAGGGGSQWNKRLYVVRVSDPRGFEIEIEVSNLLFILKNCSSDVVDGVKGKFVYAWQGTELVLLPVASPDYAQATIFTSRQTMKVTRTDMVPGRTYVAKDCTEMLYLGRHEYYEWDTIYTNRTRSYRITSKKHHVYVKLDSGGDPIPGHYICQDGFTKLAGIIDKKESTHYKTMLQDFIESTHGTECDTFQVNVTPYTTDEIVNKFKYYEGLCIEEAPGVYANYERDRDVETGVLKGSKTSTYTITNNPCTLVPESVQRSRLNNIMGTYKTTEVPESYVEPNGDYVYQHCKLHLSNKFGKTIKAI